MKDKSRYVKKIVKVFYTYDTLNLVRLNSYPKTCEFYSDHEVGNWAGGSSPERDNDSRHLPKEQIYFSSSRRGTY